MKNASLRLNPDPHRHNFMGAWDTALEQKKRSGKHGSNGGAGGGGIPAESRLGRQESDRGETNRPWRRGRRGLRAGGRGWPAATANSGRRCRGGGGGGGRECGGAPLPLPSMMDPRRPLFAEPREERSPLKITRLPGLLRLRVGIRREADGGRGDWPMQSTKLPIAHQAQKGT